MCPKATANCSSSAPRPCPKANWTELTIWRNGCGTMPKLTCPNRTCSDERKPCGKIGQTVSAGVYTLRMLTLFQKSAGTPRTGVSLERLEPCEGKLSHTVLRGLWAG